MLLGSLLGKSIVDLFILPEAVKDTGTSENYYLKI